MPSANVSLSAPSKAFLQSLLRANWKYTSSVFLSALESQFPADPSFIRKNPTNNPAHTIVSTSGTRKTFV